MILAFDTYYSENKAKTVCVVFDQWTDAKPKDVLIDISDSQEEYVPGEFYKRELPCILKVLTKFNLEEVELIIIDGFVVLDDSGKPGLGGHLYEHLNRRIPVIGVAKTNYAQNNNNKTEVFRGKSMKPLYVTSLGISKEEAAKLISNMHGEFRIPTILKYLDTLTKE